MTECIDSSSFAVYPFDDISPPTAEPRTSTPSMTTRHAARVILLLVAGLAVGCSGELDADDEHAMNVLSELSESDPGVNLDPPAGVRAGRSDLSLECTDRASGGTEPFLYQAFGFEEPVAVPQILDYYRSELPTAGWELTVNGSTERVAARKEVDGVQALLRVLPLSSGGYEIWVHVARSLC